MLFSADQLWHVFPFLSFQGAVHQYWWSIRDDAVRRAQGKYRLLTFDFGQLEKLTFLHVSLLKCSPDVMARNLWALCNFSESTALQKIG